MYNFSQLITLTKLLWYALLIFIILNVSMWVSTTLAPSFLWIPKQFFGVNFVKENYQRIQGAKAYYRDPIKKNNASLVVILGLSSASEGISVQQLEKYAQEREDDNTRFLSLSGAGRNFKEIDLYAKPLVNSTLDSALVILAINPFHLMDPPSKQADLWQVYNKTPRLLLLAGWFTTKRDDLRHLVDMKILDIRTSLFSWLNNRVDEKSINPWRETTFMDIPPLQTAEQWQKKLDQYGNRGYYKIQNYQNSQQQTRVLAKLLKFFGKKGIEVIIVFMPEHTSLYQSVPNDATQTLINTLGKQLSPDTVPKIINMRQAVPDNGFNDIAHMNKDGREIFTRKLDELVLKEHLQL